ncbi:ribose transport system ATP-binding protein [Hydrogenispora ethanolica]|uniref:Ribose transport system ATP-binding protein n=1 Tax=Hydrogenispora ethanolica TaxID=1082276 RepID=A0A4R1SAB2_HYDET|nr:ATP-binding cassette domain-containing protein [Hydrogenispora ethanolica]TCL76289.1 ribose transport system ATP-binding protein [Hydrogenispora ethanolica]
MFGMENGRLLEKADTLLAIKNLRINGVSKDYCSINLDLNRGRIHAIMGESGAGKTGLAHILAGMRRCDQGAIEMNGQPIEIRNPRQPFALGIGVLFQNTQLSFIPHLTVKEYLYLWADTLIVSGKRLADQAARLLRDYEIRIDPHALVSDLSQEECRLLALMKLLARDPAVVVLDEPTSDLSEIKKQHFFRIIRRFAEKGSGVLYLSNKLDEILQIGDEVTILKDGGTVAHFPIDYAKKHPETILGLYFGREVPGYSSDDEFKEVMDTILHTTELLTSEYELQDLLNLLAEKIAEISKADGCNILLLDEFSANVVECFRHLPPGMAAVELKEAVVRAVINDGKPLIVNHVAEAEMAHYFQQASDVKAMICVPIRMRTKINGAIEVFYSQPKNFTPEEIELLMTFATQVAIAIENTRLLGRSTLLKEAHHRIKNNLQSIISLLILQLETDHQKSLPAIVWQIIDRIKTIASVHEILSQDERGIGLINFQNLLKLIHANFQEKDRLNRIKVRIQADDLYVSYRTATSLGLVVNELLANCFEHAFPDGRNGTVMLRLEHDENRVYLQVKDDGVGCAGPGPNSSDSLGLTLVKTLVHRDLRGTIEISSSPGTKVSVVFPKQQINY